MQILLLIIISLFSDISWSLLQICIWKKGRLYTLMQLMFLYTHLSSFLFGSIYHFALNFEAFLLRGNIKGDHSYILSGLTMTFNSQQIKKDEM